jgi:agmatinase
MVIRGVQQFKMKENSSQGYTTPFGIEEEYTRFETAKYHLIYVPYGKTVSYLPGTEKGPEAIIEASTQVELYDIHTEREPYLEGISFETVNTENETGKILEDIKYKTVRCLDSQKFPVLLGGEHTISIGGINACASRHSDLTVLQIDAHADLRNEYQDDPYSHACVMRRAFEQGIQVVQIGIRSLCSEEHQLIKDNPEQIATFISDGQKPDIELILSRINNTNVYLTIDLDGLDPSVIPHVGTPEPGGLLWNDTINILEQLFINFNVIAADIVELCPDKTSTVSDFAAAKLLYKLLALKT